MGIGGIFNAAATVGLAATSGSKQANNLKDFLTALSKHGVQVRSNFEVQYNGFVGLQFFITQISTPGIKSNNGQIYYKGRVVQVPVNYEQDHEFQMTVMCDGEGFIYQMMRQIMINDYMNKKINNGYTMRIKACGDGVNTGGSMITMTGVRITNISGLEYGTTSNDIQTFTVQCYVNETQIQSSSTKTSGGLLGGIDKVSTTIANITGR